VFINSDFPLTSRKIIAAIAIIIIVSITIIEY